MKRVPTFLSVLAMMVVGLSAPAHAALLDMHDGTIYDTDTHLSWLKEAGTGGNKTWDEAVTWVASLNAGQGFAGLTGWRLPNADPACSGDPFEGQINCANSEMGHLYYTELGNPATGPGARLTNRGPFENLRARYYYWSGTQYAPNPTKQAWFFSFYDGTQGVSVKRNSQSLAWAVRPGVRSQSPQK